MNRNVVHNEKRHYITTRIQRQQFGTIADYLRKEQPLFYFENCRVEETPVQKPPIMKYLDARKSLKEDPRYKEIFGLKSRNTTQKNFWQHVLQTTEREYTHQRIK